MTTAISSSSLRGTGRRPAPALTLDHPRLRSAPLVAAQPAAPCPPPPQHLVVRPPPPLEEEEGVQIYDLWWTPTDYERFKREAKDMAREFRQRNRANNSGGGGIGGIGGWGSGSGSGSNDSNAVLAAAHVDDGYDWAREIACETKGEMTLHRRLKGLPTHHVRGCLGYLYIYIYIYIVCIWLCGIYIFIYLTTLVP